MSQSSVRHNIITLTGWGSKCDMYHRCFRYITSFKSNSGYFYCQKSHCGWNSTRINLHCGRMLRIYVREWGFICCCGNSDTKICLYYTRLDGLIYTAYRNIQCMVHLSCARLHHWNRDVARIFCAWLVLCTWSACKIFWLYSRTPLLRTQQG